MKGTATGCRVGGFRKKCLLQKNFCLHRGEAIPCSVPMGEKTFKTTSKTQGCITATNSDPELLNTLFG
jgi:hypothetical protein